MKPKGGLLIAIGGPKKPPMGKEPEEEKEPEESGDDMDSYLDEAFEAVQDGDKEGFKLALKGALECM